MSSRILVLLLLPLTLQDAKQAEPDAKRAARAAIVDRIMAEPLQIRILRPGVVAEVPQPPPAPVIQMQAQRRMTLEYKQVAIPEGGDDADDRQQLMVARPLNITELALGRDNFDRWVFGENVDEKFARKRLDSLLAVKLENLATSRRFDDTRLAKLRLAGSGDIKRFFDRVSEYRGEFETLRQDYAAGRVALGQLAPLSADYENGLFGNDSLFAKTLRGFEREAASPGGK